MLRNIINNFSRGEKIVLLVLSFFLMVVTAWPYLYLRLEVPSGYSYDYTSFVNSADYYYYYSLIRQAESGHWLFSNLSTTEITLNTFRPFWLLVGKLGGLLHLSPPLIFHLVRLLLIPVVVCWFYLIISYFFKDKLSRFLSIMLLTLTSGLGWVYILVKPFFWQLDKWWNVPFDYFGADSFLFSAMFISPHFIVSWMLLISAIFFGYLTLVTKKNFYLLVGGLSGLVLFFIQPFFLPVVPTLLFCYWLLLAVVNKRVDWSAGLKLLLLSFFYLPPLVYYYWLFQFDWTIGIKTMQNHLPSPDLKVVLFTFLIPWLLAIIGGWQWWHHNRRQRKLVLFLLLWANLGWLFIYAPVLWQKRLVVGWHFPLVVLASQALIAGEYYLRKRLADWNYWHYFVWPLLLLLFVVSNINIIATGIFFHRQSDIFYYYPTSLKSVAAWLDRQTPKQATILSNNQPFYILPGLTSRKFYFAHLVETVFSHSKYLDLLWFFDNDLNSEKKYEFLRRQQLDYIVYDRQTVGFNSFNPDDKNYLRQVYQYADYAIYEIIYP